MKIRTYYWTDDFDHWESSTRMSEGRRASLLKQGCTIRVGYGDLPDKEDVDDVVKVKMDRAYEDPPSRPDAGGGK